MNTITQDVRKRINHDQRVAKDMLNRSVVVDEESARLFGKGLQKLKEMSKDDYEKLKDLTAEQIIKGWEDSDVKVMAKAVEYTMNYYNDVMSGMLRLNPAFSALKKDLSHLQDPSRMVRTVSNIMEMTETAGIDLGWRRAFDTISVNDAKSVQVLNFRAGLRFLEMAHRSDKPKAMTVGGNSSDKVDPRYFAAGLRYADQDMQYSMLGVNTILSIMRQEALHTQTILAYRKIFEYKVGSTLSVGKAYSQSDNQEKDKWSVSGLTDAEKIERYRVYEGRYTINEARRNMIDAASQVQGLDTDVPAVEAPIRVTATDPLLYYHYHGHREYISKLQRQFIGEDGMAPVILDSDTAFIETSYAPKCGGIDVTKNTKETDAYGFRETVKESFSQKTVGGMLVIPSNLNYFLLFRGLTFLNQRDVMSESDIIGAKFEANPVMDKRQKWHVTLTKR